jgi:hypothetical protein
MFAQPVQLERQTPLGVMTHLETTRNATELRALLINEW